MKLEGTQIERARAMRGEGISLRAIASLFGCSPDTVQRMIDPDMRVRRAAQKRAGRAKLRAKLRAENLGGKKWRIVASHRIDVSSRPPIPQPEPLGQVLFGDPLPGRSALDNYAPVRLMARPWSDCFAAREWD